MASGAPRVAVILNRNARRFNELPGPRHRADYPERQIWATRVAPEASRVANHGWGALT